MGRIPLAEQMRPQTLDEVIGQSHLLGEGELLRQIARRGEPVSLILWGPPGTGKTTLARIIAREVNAEFIELSAVTSGKKDVERVIEHARQNWNLGLRTILFVDEIHRFNKAQQDAFLPHVESGLITLIGATTENPSFEVITPLLSRTRVLVLHQLTKDEIVLVLKRALKTLKQTKRVSPKALDYLAELADGDARVALGNLELVLSFGEKVTPEVVKAAAQRRLPGYDKKGDAHYDVISAFIKSVISRDFWLRARAMAQWHNLYLASGSPTRSTASNTATAKLSAPLPARPMSSDAKTTIRRAMNFGSSPASIMRAK